MFVSEFAVYYTSYSVKIYFYILFKKQDSKITRIRVQRSQTFLYFVIYMEKVRKVLRIRCCSYSLSRNSRCLYRSGDARGAYRSTLGYELKVAHLAFQRLRRFLVYDLPPYSHVEYVSDKRSLPDFSKWSRTSGYLHRHVWLAQGNGNITRDVIVLI